MAVYKYNDSALFVTGSVALSSSLYVSWGSGTGSAATVGIRQNANGTLEFRDNATGSWTEFGSSLDDTTFGDSATDVYTFIGQITASQGALIADDKKLYFGTGQDASIEYDENGTDELRFAGAAATFEQDVTFDNNVTLGVAATDITTVTSRLTASQGALVADDMKLWFGSGQDAYIEYDEAGTDELIISGALGGIDIKMPQTVTDAFTLSDATGVFLGVNTSGGSFAFYKKVYIVDDTKLYFGTGGDASIEYDEDGTDELRFAGAAVTFEQDATFDNDVTLGVATTDITTVTGRLTASQGMLISDDKKLYFGTGQDASIEYDENGSDRLVIDAPAGGVDITGSLYVSGSVYANEYVVDTMTTTITNIEQRGSTKFGDSSDDTHEFSGSLYVADDAKIYFGGNQDAYIEYDENGRNRLIVSGASAGIEISGSAYHTGSYNLSGTFTISGPSSLPMLVMDDADASAQIGRAHIGYVGSSDYAAFAHQDNATATNFCISQRSSGQTDINTKAGTNMTFRYASATRMQMDQNGNFSVGGNYAPGTHKLAISGSTLFGQEATDIHEFTGSLHIADDAKLYFGGNQDASIEYDEDGTDELIISGALGGIDIQMPQAADALTLSYDGTAWMTVSTAGGQSDYAQFNKSVNIIDDTGLYFGSGFDASIEYDEDGTDTLLVAGSAAGMTMADDFYLYFGTGLDAKIYYDESSADELIISGALGGIDIQMPQAADALTLSYAGGAWMTVSTAGGQSDYTQFNKSVNIIDDTGLYFGSGFDINMQYDEDGTDTLLVDGTGGMTLADDFKLYFGTGLDASIEYDEDGTDELIISGALGGINIQVPVQVSDALTVGDESGAYFTINTTTNNTTTQFNKPVLMPDDTHIWFGTDYDANIEYDENNTNKLIISGATGGFDIDLPDNVASAFEITEEANLYLRVVTTNGQEGVQFHKTAQIADDVKLYFGNDGDAHIEYDEDGTDELVLSGAAGGIDIQVPVATADALTISSDGSAYMTISTVGAQQKYTQFNRAVNIIDDTGLYFGSDFDISLEYDENGTNTLLVDGSAAGMTMADDVKLYFGTGLDASIEYDEDGTDELIISGAVGGVDIKLAVASSDALTISDETGAYMTVSTVGEESRYTQFNKPINIIDDTSIYFGTGFDVQMEYDENGTDTLLIGGSAAGMTISDDFYLYFGTGLDAKIYYDEDSTDELIISGALGGISILGPLSSTDSVTIGSAAGSLMTVDSANMVTIFNESAKIADDKKLYFGDGEEASIEYDENGTDRLIFTVPSAGMSIGPGFHRVAQDVTVNKAHSGDNSVAVQMQGVFVPNNSIITKVVAIPSVLSNLGTAIYNLSISATNGTAADSSVATPTEILGAGASDTEDSDGGSASDIVLSSGGVNKKVWINETNIKTTYDAFVYVANAGTGNGTTDPSQGTLHVIVEYYGLE